MWEPGERRGAGGRGAGREWRVGACGNKGVQGRERVWGKECGRGCWDWVIGGCGGEGVEGCGRVWRMYVGGRGAKEGMEEGVCVNEVVQWRRGVWEGVV